MAKTAMLATAVMIASLGAVGGCQSVGLVESGQVSLDKAGEVGVHLMWAEVRQEGEFAVISGSLVPKGAGTWKRVGHVDVELIDADGQLVKRSCSDPIYVTLRGPGRGTRIKRFETRTLATVPANGRMKVSFHYGLCEGSRPGAT